MGILTADCAPVLESGGKFLGTGPFQLDSASADNFRMLPNPHFRGQVALEGIDFVAYPPDAQGGHSQLAAAVAAGEVDLTTSLARNEVTQLTGVCKQFLPSNSTAMLFMNTEQPKLADARLRRAIAHAIDRRAVTATCHSNVATAERARALQERQLDPATPESRTESPGA